eukprot:s119_g80.t1
MSVDMEELEFASLVPISEQKVLYVLEWQDSSELDGKLEAKALVVMKRSGGLLVAPVGFLPDSELQLSPGSAGVVGASVELEVAGVMEEGGVESPIGISMKVLVVDLDSSVAPQFRVAEEVEDMALCFSAEGQYAASYRRAGSKDYCLASRRECPTWRRMVYSRSDSRFSAGDTFKEKAKRSSRWANWSRKAKGRGKAKETYDSILAGVTGFDVASSS